MLSESAIDEALSRIAHRISKGPKWIDREKVEWYRCGMLLEAEDAELDRAVSGIVAGKDSYNLDLLLSKIGKRRAARPAGQGCVVCTGGMVEAAIWRGDEVSASNPEIKAFRCKCNKGGLIKDTCYLIRQGDPTITEIYVSAEKVDGQIQHRYLNREETGEAHRNRMRKAGVDWPGSVPWMAPMQTPSSPSSPSAPPPKPKPTDAPRPARASSVVAAALQQLARHAT